MINCVCRDVGHNHLVGTIWEMMMEKEVVGEVVVDW
jgi:hypothetical protein